MDCGVYYNGSMFTAQTHFSVANQEILGHVSIGSTVITVSQLQYQFHVDCGDYCNGSMFTTQTHLSVANHPILGHVHLPICQLQLGHVSVGSISITVSFTMFITCLAVEGCQVQQPTLNSELIG